MRLNNEDPEVRPEEMDANADAEQRLQKIAAEKRADYEASPQETIRRLEEFAYRTLPRMHHDTLREHCTSTRTVERDGSISIRTVPGIDGNMTPLNSIVTSNGESVGARADRIAAIREEAILLISMIKEGKSPTPGDLSKWIEELLATIPAIGEMKIILDTTTGNK